MRKLLFAALLVLAACDGQSMDVFVGHSEQTLRDSLGPPTAVVYVPDGTRVLTYRIERQYAALPASGPLDDTAQAAPFCSTSFIIRNGFVASLSHFGNDCPFSS